MNHTITLSADKEEQERYVKAFGKINICHTVCFLNLPNPNLLQQIQDWCVKHDCRIEESSFKSSIRISSSKEDRDFKFEDHLNTLELFSL